MSTDRRELILERLVTVLGEMSGIASVWRNRGSLGDDEINNLPAVIVLDGREEEVAEIGSDMVRSKMPRMPFTMMRMFPEIVLQLYPRDTLQQLYMTVNGDSIASPTGPELSDWRNKIMNAVINDAVIVGTGPRDQNSLITTNGHARYIGCETDYRIGAPMTGQMMMGFVFHYPLEPPRP